MNKSQLKFLNEISHKKIIAELYRVGFSKIGIQHKTGVKLEKNKNYSNDDFKELKKLYIFASKKELIK